MKPPALRTRLLRAGLSTLMLISIIALPGEPPASATDNFLPFVDVHGPDDATTQSDLVQTFVDYSHLDDANSVLYVRWTWDETSFPGANTGDACALFDTDGDGNANWAVCVTVDGNPASQTADSPRLYDCTADSRNDRCGGATQITTVISTCSTALVSGDTEATCTIDMDDVGGLNSSLLNTCSFNSSEPNSNPPDCVFHPGMGLTLVKDVTDDAAVETGFAISVEGTGTINATATGDDSFFIALPPGTHSVDEIAVPAGYVLDSSSCSTGTPDSFTLTLGGVELITCTFVNRPGVPSLSAVKTFTADPVSAGSTGNTFTIEVTNNGEVDLSGVSVADTVDPALTVTNITTSSGDCSASSGNQVDCTISSLAVGATATVTVTFSVGSGQSPTTVSNTANISSTETPTPTPASDTVDITEDVTLTATKTFTADPVVAGSTGNTFTIEVTNTGSSTADNINITDTVDPDTDRHQHLHHSRQLLSLIGQQQRRLHQSPHWLQVHP